MRIRKIAKVAAAYVAGLLCTGLLHHPKQATADTAEDYPVLYRLIAKSLHGDEVLKFGAGPVGEHPKQILVGSFGQLSTPRITVASKMCPIEQQSEIQLGTAKLVVSSAAIALLNLSDGTSRLNVCEYGPFRAKSILFYDYTTALVDLYRRHSLRPFYLELSDPAARPRPQTSSAAIVKKVWHVGSSSIEELELTGPLSAANTRRYRLLDFDDRTPNAVEVTCDGDPVTSARKSRICTTEYLYRNVIVLRYAVQQDSASENALRNGLVPPGAIPEPEGLLLVDSNVRTLIDELLAQEP